jgi:diguanylate cyclase (GGDEF)-like protein
MASQTLTTRSRTQLLLVLGVVTVSVLPLLLLASVSISRQRGVAIDRAYDALEGVAAAQVGHLEGIATADQELSELLASNAQLRNGLIAHDSGDDIDAAKLDGILGAAMNSSDRLVNICLHSRDGTDLASVDPDAGDRYGAYGLRPGSEHYVSRVVGGPAGEPTAITNAEIIVNGVHLGTVTIETDTAAIHELVTDYEGLSETGETSVAQATTDGAQLIAPLRFKDDAVLALIVPQTATAAPITLAMAGEAGRFGDTVDYRQTEVLAVTRHVEKTGWGVVVKIDREEALAGVEHFQGTVAITLAGVILLVLMISFAVGKMVWRPVREVTAAAVSVAGGDRSRRADVYRFDELGDLAGAVNTMTDELVHAATADASRRVELEQVNSLLLSSEERLTHQAQHDELTGLANRFQLRDMLERALVSGAEGGHRIAVLFIDLDRFKMVNDSRGHLAGDQLLLQVAHRIENTMHADDTVARFGGDEFVVVCPDAQSLDRVEALAEGLHASLEGSFTVDGEPEHVACSIGIAISADDSTPDSLVSDADVAMYRAKSAGRNRSVLFDIKMRRWVKDRHDLESALRNALTAGELRFTISRSST